MELVKPEIVFRSIEKAISEGKRVGFAIPRREVVKEIYDRLNEVFPSLRISLVYGGHNEYLDGDIICLTCHQCYRYANKFGLLIIDEYDAFPLKGDNTLLNIVKLSCYGKIIYLSATFTKEQLLNKESLSIQRRYHNFDIPLPKIIKSNCVIFRLIKEIKRLSKNTLFIYLPTIKLANNIHIILKLFKISSIVFTSKSENKESILKDIKEFKVKIIICTTILERGITVKNVNVIVAYANHNIFDTQTLIQISGRVGRKIGSEDGVILYISKEISNSMEESIKIIMEKNNGIK